MGRTLWKEGGVPSALFGLEIATYKKQNIQKLKILWIDQKGCLDANPSIKNEAVKKSCEGSTFEENTKKSQFKFALKTKKIEPEMWETRFFLNKWAGIMDE